MNKSITHPYSVKKKDSDLEEFPPHTGVPAFDIDPLTRPIIHRNVFRPIDSALLEIVFRASDSGVDDQRDVDDGSDNLNPLHQVHGNFIQTAPAFAGYLRAGKVFGKVAHLVAP